MKPAKGDRLRRAARLLGSVLALLWLLSGILSSLQENGPVTAESVMMAAMIGTAVMAVITAWWRPRLGGILLLLFGLAFSSFAYFSAGRNKWFAVLISGVPFLMVGGLFLLAWRRRQIERPLSMRERQNYYIVRLPRLLKTFEKISGRYRHKLLMHFRDEAPDEIVAEARLAFRRLIPEIPYIGGERNSLTRILVDCIVALAYFQVLKQRGYLAEEIGPLVLDIEAARIKRYPQFLLRLAGRLLHTRWGQRRLRRTMVEGSQANSFPEGWVATFVEGDGRTFDFGVDFTECALCKLFPRQGAAEFTPYLCQIDFIQQEALNSGFFRTSTLAEGGRRCDFRWKKGRQPQSATALR